jgi:hypothetical protein
MKKMKWVVLFLALVLVAGVAIGCGSGNGNGNDDPVVVPGPAVTTHGTEGAYETCTNCHGTEIAESHEGYENWEGRCLDCHEEA